MTFQLVCDSQQDLKWKQDILGFALTSGAMLINGHGFVETSRSLTQKLKSMNGFVRAWYLKKTQTADSVIETAPDPRSTVEAPVITSTPASYQMIVIVKSRGGKFGAKVYETESVKSHIVSTEKINAKLAVIEDPSKARPKIGKAGKWLNVQTQDGKRGFVNAELVALAE
jgi:hypothetical protein